MYLISELRTHRVHVVSLPSEGAGDMPDDGIGDILRVLWIDSLGLESCLPGLLIANGPFSIDILNTLSGKVRAWWGSAIARGPGQLQHWQRKKKVLTR